MHISDALISPTVATASGIVSISLIAWASKKIKEIRDTEIIPLMGVMGAFVFAAQMINFSIPGTGSSGHLIGGILLSALLGPWCAFITLSSIIIVQCLLFADGGLLAIGCNIINMAATSCLIAYPLVYRPLAKNTLKPWRITLASILASVCALELGAFLVTLETKLSGVTVLPFDTFLKFMLSIHFVIAIIEGFVTASLILFLAYYRPSILNIDNKGFQEKKNSFILIVFGIFTLILALGFSFLASENPDGLEWSIEKVAGSFDFGSANNPVTAIMPEYNTGYAGIIGAVIVLTLVWGLTSLVFSNLRKKK